MNSFKGLTRIRADELTLDDPAIDWEPISFERQSPTIYPSKLNAVSESIGNAYIDIVELDRAIAMYYAGQLDHVEASRCNAPLIDLVPGCPLISQLDQAAMAAAIAALPIEDAYLIEAVHSHQHADNHYADALLKLSELIVKIIL